MIFFIKFAKTEIIGTLKIKWVNGGTIDIGTFVIEKRGNKSKESNKSYGPLQKRKMCCLFLFLLIETFPKEVNIN